MRRIVATIALGCIMTAGAWVSAQTAKVEIGSATGWPGAVVRLPVSVAAGSTPLAGMNARLTYDPGVLELIAPSVGPLVTDKQNLYWHEPERGVLNLIVCDTASAEPFASSSGVACYLLFRVRQGAAQGASTIGFAAGLPGPPALPASGLSDAGGQSIGHGASAGLVTIGAAPEAVESFWMLF